METFRDQKLTCRDCGVTFTWSAAASAADAKLHPRIKSGRRLQFLLESGGCGLTGRTWMR
jgi:hypothetical protein